jgi:hypothetical protein
MRVPITYKDFAPTELGPTCTTIFGLPGCHQAILGLAQDARGR